MIEVLNGISVACQKSIFGEYDAYAKILERSLHVTLLTRDDEIRIVGEPGPVARAKAAASLFLRNMRWTRRFSPMTKSRSFWQAFRP